MTFRGGSFLPGLASLVLSTHAPGWVIRGPSLASGLSSLQVRTGCCASSSVSSTRTGSRAPADLCCAVPRQALATQRQSPEGQGCSCSGPSENVSELNCSHQEGPEQSGAAVCRQSSKVTSGKSSAAPRLRAHVCACVLVHMAVGVQVRTRVCWRVCLCVSTCAGAHACGCASVCTCMSAHMSLCMQVCACVCAGTLPLCV